MGHARRAGSTQACRPTASITADVGTSAPLAVLAFDLTCRFQSTFPAIALDRLRSAGWTRVRFLLDHIQALRLDRPILCGWSYGPLVILDYVRHYGEEAVGGMSFVGGITKPGSDEAISVLTPEFLSHVPGFFSADVEESARSLESLLRMCLAEEPSPEELYLMLGYNLLVPPHVRQALFSRSFSNDDLLPKLRKPVLIVHGAQDAIVKPAVVDQHKAGVAHARVEMIPNTGHAPFWEDAAAFNGHLQRFCERLEVQAVP